MTRRLTPEERELWERLGRTVIPLKKRTERGKRRPAAAAAPKPDEPAAEAPAKQPARIVSQSPKPQPLQEPVLAPLEDKMRRRLARGLAEVDARIDLHGMRQERAFETLALFLRQAQIRGQRIVLVITGKGSAESERGRGRGVLRQTVPDWLRHPELRGLVGGFEEANRRHGGAGALYVRIRRRRAAGSGGPTSPGRHDGSHPLRNSRRSAG